jgi:hypothetical protein
MSRIVVESLSNVNVNELNGLGAFECPMEFPFMGLKTSRNVIEYHGANWRIGRPPQLIPIQWTSCTYGGARPWFTCLCGRRVGKLYYGNGFLGCRLCGTMVYESQRKCRKARLHLKATRIRARLGDYGRPGIDAIPPRPSGMQRKTYNRFKMQLGIIEYKLIEGGIYRPRPRRERRNYAFRT